MVNVIDSFEDGDISEYSGDTGDWGTTTNAAYDGSVSAVPSAGNVVITKDDVTLSHGDTPLGCWGLLENTGISLYEASGPLFAVQSLAGENSVSGYWINYNSNIGFALARFDNGSYTELAADNSDTITDAGSWYELRITEWTDGGNISAEMRDSTGSVVASVSATDDTYGAGYIGFGSRNTNVDYYTSPELNSPPSFAAGSESPFDGATGVSVDPTLSIDVTDPDGDSMDVSFYDANDDSQIGSTQTGIADGGTASVSWSGRNFGTSYSWYAVADDGSATTTSSTFSFTTGDGIPANVSVSDDTTEGQLTISWDEVTLSGVTGYYVYRAQASGTTTSDYTQVADVTSPPYTDTGLEDGEKYYYRVSSHD